MLTNEELIAEYSYLDDLDCRGRAWELLRRNDEYRADYDRLQKLERPGPFDGEHAALAKKWHVRRLLNPKLCQVPEFFHERWQNIPDICRYPTEWDTLMKEKESPGYNPRTWKHSIICKDLKDKGYSSKKIALSLYSGYGDTSNPLESDEIWQHPLRHRVRDDLKRLEKLQKEYLKIAFSDIK